MIPVIAMLSTLLVIAIIAILALAIRLAEERFWKKHWRKECKCEKEARQLVEDHLRSANKRITEYRDIAERSTKSHSSLLIERGGAIKNLRNLAAIFGYMLEDAPKEEE